MPRRDENRSFVYILLNKPYGVLSQFTGGGRHRTLGEFGPFPRDVYAAGRLDADSEGLLLLTNDPLLAHSLTDPRFGHPRTYLVQVERVPTSGAVKQLQAGVVVAGRTTLPAEARLLSHDPPLPPRPVPIRFRKNVSTAWLELTLHEGRNRQVRKMTAAVGHPTLRLVRIAIGSIGIDGLAPGEWRHLRRDEVKELSGSRQLPR
jgi:23S rRNA pseudouridine2457 synthase